MSEEYSTYDGACSRAELLGQAPPSRSDWELANKDRKPSVSNDVTEEVDLEPSQSATNPEPKGKLEELNNIISMTTMRLDKFKKACGSLTNLLKVRGMGDERSASPLGTDAEGGGAAAAGASNELDSLQ